MTRYHLLKLPMRPHPADEVSIWRMTMDILGAAFGAPSTSRETRR